MDTVDCRNDESSNSEGAEEIKEMARQLENAYGATVARHYDMSVVQYAMTGEESPHCKDERMAESWGKAKAIIDSERAERKPKRSYEEFRLLLDRLDEIECQMPEEKEHDEGLAKIAEKIGTSENIAKWLLVEWGEDFGRDMYEEQLSHLGFWDSYADYLRMLSAELQCRVDAALSKGVTVDVDGYATRSFVRTVEFDRAYTKYEYGLSHSFGKMAGLSALLLKCKRMGDGETWEKAYREASGIEKAYPYGEDPDWSWLDEWKAEMEADES